MLRIVKLEFEHKKNSNLFLSLEISVHLYGRKESKASKKLISSVIFIIQKVNL